MFNMKESQRNHLNRLTKNFSGFFRSKFIKGAAEHGDMLHEKSLSTLVYYAKQEVADQVSYVWTLEEKLELVGTVLNDPLLSDREKLDRIHEILFGVCKTNSVDKV